MNLESPKVEVSKSAQETFDFLNNVENFEKLMPENISKFELIDDETFLFALSGMPEIMLKKRESISPNKIVLGAAGGKIDFSLVCDIVEVNESTSTAKLNFQGKFNPMMAMMIKGPITKFIGTLAGNMPSSI